MVQLSTPSPDLIPVPREKSPDKAPGLKSKNDGFKTVMMKQKESRDSEKSQKRSVKASSESKTGESRAAAGTVDRSKGRAEHVSSVSPSDEQNPLMMLTPSGKEEKAVLTDSDQNIKSTVKKQKAVSNKQNTIIATTDPVLSSVLPESVPQKQIVTEQTAAGHQTDHGDTPDVPTVLPEVSDQNEPVVLQKASDFAAVVNQENLKENDRGIKNSSLIRGKKKAADADVKISLEDRRTTGVEKPALIMKEVESDGSANRITLELQPSEELPGMMPQAESNDPSGRNFVLQTAEEQKGAALLDRQLQDKGTQELTKNIRFVLKDNNEGEIKLILKPEALGKVRINLNLHENNIVGKIIVENNNVRQAFMNNLADLTRALEDSGFSSASLDVSVGGGQTDARRQADEKPVFFSKASQGDLDGQIPVIYEEGATLSQVNLVV